MTGPSSDSSSAPAGDSAGASASGGPRPASSADRSAADFEPIVGREPEDEGTASDHDAAEPEADQEADQEAEPTPEPDPLSTAIRERDDYRDALIRLQADFENYKKRMIKQQTDHLERAAAALVDKLLPVLDTADLALAHGSGEDVKQVTAALSGVLEREG